MRWYQQTYVTLRFLLVGVITLGVLLDALANSSIFKRPLVSFMLMIIIIVLWLSIELIAHYRGIPWEIGKEQFITIKRLSRQTRLSVMGVIALLWAPHLIPGLGNSEAPQVEKSPDLTQKIDTLFPTIRISIEYIDKAIGIIASFALSKGSIGGFLGAFLVISSTHISEVNFNENINNLSIPKMILYVICGGIFSGVCYDVIKMNLLVSAMIGSVWICPVLMFQKMLYTLIESFKMPKIDFNKKIYIEFSDEKEVSSDLEVISSDDMQKIDIDEDHTLEGTRESIKYMKEDGVCKGTDHRLSEGKEK